MSGRGEKAEHDDHDDGDGGMTAREDGDLGAREEDEEDKGEDAAAKGKDPGDAAATSRAPPGSAADNDAEDDPDAGNVRGEERAEDYEDEDGVGNDGEKAVKDEGDAHADVDQEDGDYSQFHDANEEAALSSAPSSKASTPRASPRVSPMASPRVTPKLAVAIEDEDEDADLSQNRIGNEDEDDAEGELADGLVTMQLDSPSGSSAGESVGGGDDVGGRDTAKIGGIHTTQPPTLPETPPPPPAALAGSAHAGTGANKLAEDNEGSVSSFQGETQMIETQTDSLMAANGSGQRDAAALECTDPPKAAIAGDVGATSVADIDASDAKEATLEDAASMWDATGGTNEADAVSPRPAPPSSSSSSSSSTLSSSTASAASGMHFQFDSAKPWYMFGRGTVDTSGASGAPAWEPDASKSECTLCRSKFDFFRRRHHCRMDGKIYCKNCCNEFRLLPAHFGVREPQRVCKKCCATLDPMQDELAATISNATRELGKVENGDGDGCESPGGAGAAAADASASASQSSQTSGGASSLLPGPLGARVNISSPVSFSMSAEILKAAAAVDNFFGTSQQSMLRDEYIPAMLLKQAKGIAFLTVVKVGFVVTTRFGTGLVVGRDRQGSWTAPTAIGLAGLGWGAQMGGEVTDFVIILNTESAVDAFSGKNQVALGSQLSLAAGPLGRTGEASVNLSVSGEARFAPSYTYSQSKGLFVGISLEGAVIRERADVNERFYGRRHDPKEILACRVPRPKAAQPLYDALLRACERDPSAESASPMGISRASLVDEI